METREENEETKRIVKEKESANRIKNEADKNNRILYATMAGAVTSYFTVGYSVYNAASNCLFLFCCSSLPRTRVSCYAAVGTLMT